MPYFITDRHPDCSGWAVVKENGDMVEGGCHTSKDDAIDHMVAASSGEGTIPQGTYEGDFRPADMRALPDNYRPATAEDVPEGRACGNCRFFNEDMLDDEGRAWCERWEDYVAGGFYCNAWQAEDEGRQEDDASTPAPPEDQIEGSEKNEPGSASGAGGDIELSDTVKTALRNKVSEHNEKMEEDGKPDWTRTTYGQLAAVYRRGAGAYSTSHRPGVSRAAWAMARVNAYLYLLRNGRPQNSAYVTDNDLLPEDHPKSTRSDDSAVEQRQVDLSPPAYMRAAARRGLQFVSEGLGGDGLRDQTIREARAMAQGNVTQDKWVRLRAWIARHLVDLDAPAADPDSDDYPSAGVVAHLLWGSGPSKRAAERALAYAEGIVARLEEENADRARGNNVASFEVRVNQADFDIIDDSEGTRFEGYAAVFNEPSRPIPGGIRGQSFTERIANGAFLRSLKSRNDIKLLWNHDSGQVLGSTRAGTMRATEDAHGLKITAQLPDTTAGRDAQYLLKRGDVDSMSFGFTVPRGGDDWNDSGDERVLREVMLHEVSIVAFPAYEQTAGSTSVRGLAKVAQRSGVDVDALADALLKLENGETMTDEDTRLLTEVLDSIGPEAPADTDQPAEDDHGKAMLELKKKKLELLMGI
jgi:HK97 family phage prohead protease